MKVVVFTVFYPGMEDFIDEYFQCIVSQTFSKLSVVVVDDDCPVDILNKAQKFKIDLKILPGVNNPQLNRIKGLKYCYDKGYNIVICSDSDEIMKADRVERVVKYFSKNKDKDVVYNNSEISDKGGKFNLNYKSVISINDVIDFNVLGYGAMNLRRGHIPFIIKHKNLSVDVFDWLLALTYLLNNQSVDFLKDVKNIYKVRDNHHVGPILSIDIDRIKLGIETKTKDLQIFFGGAKKADWDVGLTVDAIKIAPKLDTVIIVSGDGDYIPLIEYLQTSQGCQVEVIAFGKSSSSKW